MASEGEPLAGDYEGVAWQQCGSGLGGDIPVRISPDASLAGILEWAEFLLDSFYPFLYDNSKPSPDADPEQGATGPPNGLRPLGPNPPKEGVGSVS